jgi:hypothetical protein
MLVKARRFCSGTIKTFSKKSVKRIDCIKSKKNCQIG